LGNRKCRNDKSVEEKTYKPSPFLEKADNMPKTAGDWRTGFMQIPSSAVGENKGTEALLNIAENTNPKIKEQDILANMANGQATAPNAKIGKGLDGISGGGSKSVTINVNKFQDKTEIHVNKLGESTNEIETNFAEMFYRIINGANQSLVN
jgi:hypothetical protein